MANLYTEDSDTKDSDKQILTQWYWFWPIYPMIILSYIPPLGLYLIDSQLVLLGWLINSFCLTTVNTLIYSRLRYWPTGELIHLCDNAIYYGKYIICDFAPKPVTSETLAKYIKICQRWWQLYQSGRYETDTEMINSGMLAATRGELSNAQRAWRSSRFDDRRWWPQLKDAFFYCFFDDNTRYMPSN